jgi:hypothetical protein
LEQGEQVKLSEFGNFALHDKRARPGPNPKTGEDIPMTARRMVTFCPGQKLKTLYRNQSRASDIHEDTKGVTVKTVKQVFFDTRVGGVHVLPYQLAIQAADARRYFPKNSSGIVA